MNRHSVATIVTSGFVIIIWFEECDKSCGSCTGDGPDECVECAANFELRDGMCKGKC